MVRPMTESPSAASVIIDIGTTGQRLMIVSGGAAEMWDAWITVEAYPFSGVIKTVLTTDDIAQYRSALRDFDVHGRAVLGGHRPPEVTLVREDDVIEVQVTPSGDDPWPTIKYLIFLNRQPDPALVTFPHTD
jgi:hypothetical protein